MLDVPSSHTRNACIVQDNTFSRESKYEIRALRVVACVRKFLYTVTQKMGVYELKLAKMTKKTAKISPDASERPNGRTASAQIKTAKSTIFAVFYVKKLIFDKKITNRCFSMWF